MPIGTLVMSVAATSLDPGSAGVLSYSITQISLLSGIYLCFMDLYFHSEQPNMFFLINSWRKDELIVNVIITCNYNTS